MWISVLEYKRMMHLQAQSKNRKRHEDEEKGLGDVTEEAIDNIRFWAEERLYLTEFQEEFIKAS